MTRMRNVIRGADKDVFDKAFDAFNKDAQIAKGEFHISGIVATGDVTRHFILEGLELRRETKDRIMSAIEANRYKPSIVEVNNAKNHLGRLNDIAKGLGGATHLIKSSAKIVAKGSMDKLGHDEPVQSVTRNIGELEATIRGVKQCFH